MNAYAALYRANHFPVERLTIAAILRDWQKSRIHEDNYPPIPFMEIHPRLWAPEQAEEWLCQRVRIHQLALTGDYPPCTPEERWARPDTWAVKKLGGKRAVSGGLHETEADALAFISGQADPLKLEIEHRPGKDVRCEDWCNVAEWCQQKEEVDA